MANSKISALTALTAPATGDLIPIVDISDTTDAATGTTKKSTLATLKAAGTDIDTGTNDVLFVTAKALNDSHNVPDVAPGTSGNVMTSNGTDWASTDGLTAFPENVIRTATVSISSAELKTLFSSPLTLVAAPGAGKVVLVDECVLSYTYGGVAYVGDEDMRIQYDSDTANILGVVFTNLTGTANILTQITTASATRVTPIANKAVQLTHATPNYSTGNGTAKVFIRYRIVTL